MVCFLTVAMTYYMATTTDKLLQSLETVDDIDYFLCFSSSTFLVSRESAILIKRKMLSKFISLLITGITLPASFTELIKVKKYFV